MLNLDRFFRRDRGVLVEDHEIVPGVDKPTLILVTMVAARMIKEPKDVRKSYDSSTSSIFKYGSENLSDVSAEYTLHTKTKRVGYEDVPVGTEARNHVVKCGKERFILTDDKEKKILEVAFGKALELKVKFEAQEAENKRQDAALAAIDKFFKVEPEKPVTQDVINHKPDNAATLAPCPPYATMEICQKYHPDQGCINRPSGKVDCWYPESASTIEKELKYRPKKKESELCKESFCLTSTKSWHGYCARHAPKPV